jgi:hypothetical protein
MIKLKTVFLLTWFLSSLAWAQLNEFVVTEEGKKASLYSKFPDKSVIKIASWIEGLSFSSTMEILNQDHRTEQGVYYLVVNPKTKQRIKIRKNNFKEVNIKVPSLSVKELIEFTVAEKVNKMTDGKGSFSLKSIPANASISIDGFPDFKKVTPYKFENYSARGYKVLVLKDRYKPVEIVINIKKDKDLTQILELQKNWADILFNSSIPGAEIRIKDQIYSLPKHFEGIENGLSPGKHTYNLRAKGYQGQKSFINVEAGETRTVENDLVFSYGQLDLDISPRGTEIWHNNVLIGKSPLFIDSLGAGKHQFNFKKVNFADKAIEFDLMQYKNSISEKLNVIAGNVIVQGVPGSDLYLDDKLVGSLPFELKSLKSGNYQIKLVHPEFETWNSSVYVNEPSQNIIAGQHFRKSTLTINSTPQGAQVTLNGRSLGKTPLKNIEVDGDTASQTLIYEMKGWDLGNEQVKIKPGANRKIDVTMGDTQIKQANKRRQEREDALERSRTLSKWEDHDNSEVFVPSLLYREMGSLGTYYGLGVKFGSDTGLDIYSARTPGDLDGVFEYQVLPRWLVHKKHGTDLMRLTYFDAIFGLGFISESHIFEWNALGGIEFSHTLNTLDDSLSRNSVKVRESELYEFYAIDGDLFDWFTLKSDISIYLFSSLRIKLEGGWNYGIMGEDNLSMEVRFKNNQNVNSLSDFQKESLKDEMDELLDLTPEYSYLWWGLSLGWYF